MRDASLLFTVAKWKAPLPPFTRSGSPVSDEVHAQCRRVPQLTTSHLLRFPRQRHHPRICEEREEKEVLSRNPNMRHGLEVFPTPELSFAASSSQNHSIENDKPNNDGYNLQSPGYSATVTYSSPFRRRLAPPRSPKRQKRLPAKPTTKSRFVIELFAFLSAYTSLVEEAMLDVMELVFEDVDWEECTEMDEGRWQGWGELFAAEDEEGEGCLGRMWRGVFELSEGKVTDAFGKLAQRMRKEGWGGDGVLIPPAGRKGTEATKNGEAKSEEMELITINWSVVYNHGLLMDPIMYRAIPEPAEGQTPLYELDPHDPHILAEREEFYQSHLEQTAAHDLEQARLRQENLIRRHVAAHEAAERASEEKTYCNLIAEREALIKSLEERVKLNNILAYKMDNERFLEEMVSVISSDGQWNESSSEPEGSARASEESPHRNPQQWISRETLQWAMKISASTSPEGNDGAGNGGTCPDNGYPGLTPFPPAPSQCSPKRKAAEAGLPEDQWQRNPENQLRREWEPLDDEEEDWMLKEALKASMEDGNPEQSKVQTEPRAMVLEEKGVQEVGIMEMAAIGLGIQNGDTAGDNMALEDIARRASLAVGDVTARMDSLATRTPPMPTLTLVSKEEREEARKREMAGAQEATEKDATERDAALQRLMEVARNFVEIRKYVDRIKEEREREEGVAGEVQLKMDGEESEMAGLLIPASPEEHDSEGGPDTDQARPTEHANGAVQEVSGRQTEVEVGIGGKAQKDVIVSVQEIADEEMTDIA